MRISAVWWLLVTAVLSSPASGQRPGVQLGAGLGDSAVYLDDKSALRNYAAATYDYFLKALEQAKPEQLNRRVAIYGQPPQPAVRLAALAFEHAVWTVGQVVPCLRLNGVKPPDYRMSS